MWAKLLALLAYFAGRRAGRSEAIAEITEQNQQVVERIQDADRKLPHDLDATVRRLREHGF